MRLFERSRWLLLCLFFWQSESNIFWAKFFFSVCVVIVVVLVCIILFCYQKNPKVTILIWLFSFMKTGFFKFSYNLSAYHAFISQVSMIWNHFQFQHFFDTAVVHWTVFILSQWQNFFAYLLRCILSFSYRRGIITLINTIISSYNFPFQMNRFMMMKYMRNIRKWREFI